MLATIKSFPNAPHPLQLLATPGAVTMDLPPRLIAAARAAVWRPEIVDNQLLQRPPSAAQAPAGISFDIALVAELLKLSEQQRYDRGMACLGQPEREPETEPEPEPEPELKLRHAALCFKLARHVANPAPSYVLGILYETGLGVRRDVKAALDCFEESAAAGSAAAQFEAGRMHQFAITGPADCARALKWYLRSAEQGYAPAQRNLALLYESGAVVKSSRKARIWMEQAARQNDALAQTRLGEYLERGYGGRKDAPAAYALHCEAACQGCMIGQFNRGRCLEFGIGVNLQLESALAMYYLAARQGLACAQRAVARFLEKGRCVDVDLKVASQFYALAARQGDDEAQYKLGLMYRDARGIEGDLEQAILWFGKASTQGHVKAHACLDACLKGLESEVGKSQ